MSARSPSNRVSPSQIDRWRGCQRRWWYDRNRPRGPQNVYAAFGDRMHLQLEGWLRDGTPPDMATAEGAAAVAGVPLLPPPGVGAVEKKFDMPFEGVHYNGRVDLLYDYVPAEHIVVNDHKSIGQLRRAKTPEDLLTDSQRIVYARWAATFFNVEHVTAQWTYMQRKNPKAKAVRLREDRLIIELRFRELHQKYGLPIVAAKQLTSPDSLPRNLSNCRLYPPDGCPHKAECHRGLEPIDLAIAALETTT